MPPSRLIAGRDNARAVTLIVNPVGALNMSMAKKSKECVLLRQDGISIAGGQDIFVLVTGRSVNTLHTIDGKDRASRKLPQKLQVFRRQAFLRPKSGQSSDGIEAIEAGDAGARFVV